MKKLFTSMSILAMILGLVGAFEPTIAKANKAQSIYLSIGAGVGTVGWMESIATKFTYADNTFEKFPIGIIPAKQNASIDLEAHYGHSFKEGAELQLRLFFVAELNE